MNNIDYSSLSDEDLKNLLNQQGVTKPAPQQQQDYSKLSDDELTKLLGQPTNKPSPFKAPEQTGFRKFVDKELPFVAGTGNLVGTAVKSAATGVNETIAGVTNIANIAARTMQDVLDTEKQGGFETLKGLSKETSDRAKGFREDLSNQKGVLNTVADIAGSIASTPGGAVTIGANLGSRYVNAEDGWLAAIAKPLAGAALGGAIGKGTEAVVNKWLSGGASTKAAQEVVSSAAPSAEAIAANPALQTGQQTVSKAYNIIKETKDTLRSKVRDTYKELEPLWKDTPINPGQWSSLSKDGAIQAAIKDLSKFKAGDKVQGDIVQGWGSGIKSAEEATVGKLDALKQFMNQKSFKEGVAVKTSSTYSDAAININKLLKDTSPQYASTLEKVAPLQRANQALKNMMNKDGEVNLSKVFGDKTGESAQALANNMQRAGKEGQTLVDGYIADMIGTAGGDVSSMSTTKLIEKILPNQNVLQNIKRFLGKEDQAVMQALYQAKIAVKPDGNKLLDGITSEAPSLIGVARSALKSMASEGDMAFTKALTNGTAFSSKVVKEVIARIGSAAPEAINKINNNKESK